LKTLIFCPINLINFCNIYIFNNNFEKYHQQTYLSISNLARPARAGFIQLLRRYFGTVVIVSIVVGMFNLVIMIVMAYLTKIVVIIIMIITVSMVFMVIFVLMVMLVIIVVPVIFAFLLNIKFFEVN
jgi:hypothetical protein